MNHHTDPLIGKQVSNHIISKRIGQGAMGIVYRAHHMTLERDVAIKFLDASLAKDSQYVDRFLQEARAAARLNHPNLITVYDAGSEGDDIYYIIMEYVVGNNLSQMLDQKNVFTEEEVIYIGMKTAEALSYAHQHGMVHRDIKPENLMLTEAGILKVADLGLAKQISDKHASLTNSGVVVGTPFYISPEQVRGLPDLDSRTDIYSLGVTLFHLATGRVPYQGTSSAEIMSKHLTEEPPLANTINTQVSHHLTQVLAKMMHKKPEKRYENMQEVLFALDSVSNKKGAEENVPSRPRTESSSQTAPKRVLRVPTIPPGIQTAPSPTATFTEPSPPPSPSPQPVPLKQETPQFLKSNPLKLKNTAPPSSTEQKIHPVRSIRAGKLVKLTSIIGLLAASVYFFPEIKVFLLTLKERFRSQPVQSEVPPETPTNLIERVSLDPEIKPSEERYANGALKEQGSLKRLSNGEWVKHGRWTNYWANGTVCTFGEYRNGKQIGVWPMWLENGDFVTTNYFGSIRK